MSDTSAAEVEHLDARLNTVEQVQKRLNVGRSMAFELIGSGQLRLIKLGRRRLVPEQALREFISELDQQAQLDDAPDVPARDAPPYDRPANPVGTQPNKKGKHQ